jgi:hypothetical protein
MLEGLGTIGSNGCQTQKRLYTDGTTLDNLLVLKFAENLEPKFVNDESHWRFEGRMEVVSHSGVPTLSRLSRLRFRDAGSVSLWITRVL